MPAYRFLFADAMTDTVLGELPVESASFGEVLNAPGAFQATMPLVLSDRAARVVNANTLVPGSVSLFVERDGVIVWGGVLWTVSMDVGAGSVILGGEGFWSLARRRTIRENLTYEQVDAFTIAKSMLNYAQGLSGGDMRLYTAEIGTCGILRDRRYFGWERKNLAEAIEQLAAVQHGFDFRIAPRWVSSGVLRRDVILTFPNTGRPTGLVLDLGNLDEARVTVDASTMANVVHARGEGEAENALIITAENTAAFGHVPMMEDTLSLTTVKETETLQGHAALRLAKGAAPIVIPDVTLSPTREPALGSFDVGDVVQVRASVGILSLDAPYRVTAWTASVDGNGTEAVKLTLAPQEAYVSA